MSIRNRSVGIVLLGLLGTAIASADTQPAESSACQQEMRRIAVWPHSSPKAPQMARFEYREVKVCNGKVVSQPGRSGSRQARSPQ
jgi:hypothetical protein